MRLRQDWWLPVVLPLLLVAGILLADVLEGPKTAYVGVLAVIPMLSAVFGTPRQTGLVAVLTLLAGAGFGVFASDGNVPAQTVRLVIIAVAGIGAVLAAVHRTRREVALARAWEQVRVLDDAVEHDQLTGALSRRGILDALEGTDATEWTIALADLDGFKQVNDEHGHVVGDEYLRAMATRMSRAIDARDLLARWGGDEFLMALRLGPEQGEAVLRRVHRAVVAEPVATTSGQLPAAMTVGAARWEPDETLDDVIRRVDGAMYRGKDAGRNQVVLV